jgi:hypothetical protein
VTESNLSEPETKLSHIWQLPGLVELEFPKHISKLPAWISKAIDLECLNLIYCESLGDSLLIEPVLAILYTSLERVECEGCVKLSTPPQEVCRQGGLAVAKFLRQVNGDGEMTKSITLFLIGDGEAGKTSVLLALKSPENKACHIRADRALDPLAPRYSHDGQGSQKERCSPIVA